MTRHHHIDVPKDRSDIYKPLIENLRNYANGARGGNGIPTYAYLSLEDAADAIERLQAQGELSVQASEAYEAGYRQGVADATYDHVQAENAAS